MTLRNFVKQSLIAAIIIGLMAFLLAGMREYGQGGPAVLPSSDGSVGFNSPAGPLLPTIMEIQERIGCDVIDGRLGSETQEKWDRVICDRKMKEILARAGEGPK